MSRCYPFPPPGYENKTKIEDIDLLKKERSREKKHKKEKRDKEKKEGKGKREKDRSDEKQKEKREKHRDKRKDKEKIRDKDKNSHVKSDDKKSLGHAGEKGEKNHEKIKEREKEKSTVLAEKVMGKSAVYNGVALGKNRNLVSENKNLKQLHELGNRNGGNLFAEKYLSTEIKKDVGMPRIGVSTPATPMATSERSKERKVIDGRMGRHGPTPGGRSFDNVLVQNVDGMAQNRVDGVPRQVEKNAVRRIEVREKIRGIDGDDKKREKRKDEDREESVEKYKEKVKKIKVERPKDMGGEMLAEQSTVKERGNVHEDLLRGKDGNKKDSVLAQIARPTNAVKEDSKVATSTTPEIVRKRKECSTNGAVHGGDIVPNNLPRITSSSLSMTENGRRVFKNSTTVFAPVIQQALSNAKQDEADVGPNRMARVACSSLPVTENGRGSTPSQDSSVLTPIKQQALSKVKQNHKDHRINGTNKSPPSISRASQSAARADRNSGAVKKLLPHPDTKYLTQVLSVPKMEEWSGFDEDEWLFSRSHSQPNKPREDVSRVDDTIPQVWAEALRIDSADVYALPYVIPR